MIFEVKVLIIGTIFLFGIFLKSCSEREIVLKKVIVNKPEKMNK